MIWTNLFFYWTNKIYGIWNKNEKNEKKWTNVNKQRQKKLIREYLSKTLKEFLKNYTTTWTWQKPERKDKIDKNR